MINNQNTKICSCCKEQQNFSLFKRRNTSKDGLQGECNPCLNKKAKIYRKHHKISIQQKAKKYRESLKGIYIVCKLNGAKSRNIEFSLTFKTFSQWYKKQLPICYYCKRTLEEIKRDNHHRRTNRLTIDRKNNKRGYTLNNIVLACDICNSVKSNIFNFNEMKIIGKILRRLLI